MLDISEFIAKVALKLIDNVGYSTPILTLASTGLSAVAIAWLYLKFLSSLLYYKVQQGS